MVLNGVYLLHCQDKAQTIVSPTKIRPLEGGFLIIANL
jgi:hypothetical protein